MSKHFDHFICKILATYADEAVLNEQGSWPEGKCFGGSVSKTDLQSWIDGLR